MEFADLYKFVRKWPPPLPQENTLPCFSESWPDFRPHHGHDLVQSNWFYDFLVIETLPSSENIQRSYNLLQTVDQYAIQRALSEQKRFIKNATAILAWRWLLNRRGDEVNSGDEQYGYITRMRLIVGRPINWISGVPGMNR